MTDELQEASEFIYVPEPSWLPAIAAFALAAVLAGLFVWWPYGVVGAVVALVSIVRMFRGTSEDVSRLPRRQKLTTAVLPAVPPRKPSV